MLGMTEGDDCVVRWLLSLRLPARRPLGPRASVVICELEVDVNDGLATFDHEALGAAGGRVTQKPAVSL